MKIKYNKKSRMKNLEDLLPGDVFCIEDDYHPTFYMKLARENRTEAEGSSEIVVNLTDSCLEKFSALQDVLPLSVTLMVEDED
jgi:hypothetical protein